MITLKEFQAKCRDQIADGISALLGNLAATGDANQQRTIIQRMGCIELKAPTGSGKTLTIGRALELVARRPAPSPFRGIVWFWFTPFSGLVGQTASALRGECPGLRVRDPAMDRDMVGTRTGDVFVTTWASVAVQDTTKRRMRQDDDEVPSIDTMVTALRRAGWRIGTVVDESHHGFTSQGAVQSRTFYETVLRPDVTILTSATPNDPDIALFRQAFGFADEPRFAVSREDAVASRLNKIGVRAVSFEPDARDAKLLDPVEICIEATIRHHEAIKTALQTAGLPVVPLTLVQVENDADGEAAAERMRKLLIAKGVPEGVIAKHTADEPDANFHALAHDHDKEFLIFKVAAATGFDVPRAWILASVRKTRSKDFGLQILGRILRVHGLLQPRENLPDVLEFGYAFLAHPDPTSGLLWAAQDINALRTEMRSATDDLTVIRVTPDRVALIDRQEGWLAEFAAGQVPNETGSAAQPAPAGTAPAGRGEAARPLQATLEGVLTLTVERRRQGQRGAPAIPPAGYPYAIRDDVPERLMREILPPEGDDLLDLVVQNFVFTDEMLNRYHQEFAQALETETDVFQRLVTRSETADFTISERRVAEQAQLAFRFSQSIDPSALQRALAEKLRAKIVSRRWRTPDDAKLRHTLRLIAILHPEAFRDAVRRALASRVTCEAAAALPREIRAPFHLSPSRRNAYGVMPPLRRRVPEDARRLVPCFDSNWEIQFARQLDGDNQDAVLWWLRNEDRKEWAASVVRPDGRRYYPDLVVAVNGRQSLDQIGLVEIKERILDDDSAIKVRSTHERYGKILMLFYKENEATFYRVDYNSATGMNQIVDRFDVDMLRQVT